MQSSASKNIIFCILLNFLKAYNLAYSLENLDKESSLILKSFKACDAFYTIISVLLFILYIIFFNLTKLSYVKVSAPII